MLDVGHGGHLLWAEVLRHQLRHRHLPDDPGRIVGPQILALSQMGSGSYLGAFWVFFGVAIAALAVSFFIKPPKAA